MATSSSSLSPFPIPTNGGEPQYLYLVKRLVAVPGDHLHLHNGIVYINGVAQPQPKEGVDSPSSPSEQVFLDEFPAVPAAQDPSATPEWAVEEPAYIQDGDLVVPAGKFFMMGDHRHKSLDSRYWRFALRENIVARPLFNYWSFKTSDDQYSKTGLGSRIAWFGHVLIRFHHRYALGPARSS